MKIIVCFTILLVITTLTECVPFGTSLFINIIKNKVDHILQQIDNTSDCANHLRLLIRDFPRGKKWALEMIDASAKLNSGLISGNMIHFGHYDQCLDINENISNTTTVQGQYCNIFLRPKINENEKQFIQSFRSKGIVPFLYDNKLDEKSNILYGICLPASCSINNLQDFWDVVAKTFKPRFDVTFKEKFCDYKGKSPPNTHIDIFIWILLGSYFAFIVFCSLYDYCTESGHKGKMSNLVAFSVCSNIQKLTSSKTADDTLACIKGMKVLSAWGVIIGHTVLIEMVKFPSNFLKLLTPKSTDVLGALAANGYLAMDVFFPLSGLLLSYTYLTYVSKTTRKISLKDFYLKRYIRLIPPILATTLVAIGVLKYLGDGPVWRISAHMVSGNCLKRWWTEFLFVNNFVKPYMESCLPMTWYLSVDTQLYILSPIVLFSLHKTPLKNLAGLSVVSILSMLYIYYLTVKYEVSSIFPEFTRDYIDNFYRLIYLRIPNWSIGFIFGYIIFQYNNKKIYVPKVIYWVLWIFSSVIFAVSLSWSLVYYTAAYDAYRAAFYNAVLRSLWSLAICMVVLLCLVEPKGFVNRFLSHKVFIVLEKLNYSVFLVNPAIIMYKSFKRRAPNFFLYYDIYFYEIPGHFILIYFISLLSTLSFESPIVAFSRGGPSKKITETEKSPAKKTPKKNQRKNRNKITNISENGVTSNVIAGEIKVD